MSTFVNALKATWHCWDYRWPDHLTVAIRWRRHRPRRWNVSSPFNSTSAKLVPRWTRCSLVGLFVDHDSGAKRCCSPYGRSSLCECSHRITGPNIVCSRAVKLIRQLEYRPELSLGKKNFFFCLSDCVVSPIIIYSSFPDLLFDDVKHLEMFSVNRHTDGTHLKSEVLMPLSSGA